MLSLAYVENGNHLGSNFLGRVPPRDGGKA